MNNLIEAIGLLLWSNLYATIATLLVAFLVYKLHTFDEIIVDIKDEVPKNVRFVPGQKAPPFYPNGWIPILESRAIEPNQVKSVLAFGLELAVIRGAAGRAFVIDAYCPHLGANLAVGGVVHRNECNEECIQCPFHGWSFRINDGQCSSVPYEDKAQTPNAKVKVWESVEINNAIFVWYHADGKPPSWTLQPVPEVANQTWTYQGRTEHYVNCYFQEIPENGADVAHLGQIHTDGILLGSDLNRINQARVVARLLEHQWSAEWNPCAPPEEHMSHIDIVNRNKLLGYELFHVNLQVNQIGPAYVELRFETNFLGGLKGVLLQFVKPIGRMRNVIVHQVYCQSTPVGYVFGKFLLYAEAKMLERDIQVWNRKAFLKKPYFAKSEKSLVKYRRWFNQFYSESSKISLEW